MTFGSAIRRGMIITASTLLLTANLTTASAQSSRGLERTTPVQESHKTYLINGLASIMPFVGYGFNNLKRKIGNAKHYSYATPIEGRLAVQPAVLSEIKREYSADPNVKINLIGISYGANIVTSLAAHLNKQGIPVNYLGVLDGPVLAAVPPNVRKVDNFYCRIPGCIGAKVRLTPGNNVTQHEEFKHVTTHIGLGDHNAVHERILAQLVEPAPVVRPETIMIAHTPQTRQLEGTSQAPLQEPVSANMAYNGAPKFENLFEVGDAEPLGPPIDLLATGSIK